MWALYPGQRQTLRALASAGVQLRVARFTAARPAFGVTQLSYEPILILPGIPANVARTLSLSKGSTRSWGLVRLRPEGGAAWRMPGRGTRRTKRTGGRLRNRT